MKDTADGGTCKEDAQQRPETKTISLEQAAALAARDLRTAETG